MLEGGAAPIANLYVHVPFCAQKCAYCAFFSEPSSGELINRFSDALVRELELVAFDLRPDTIFFGGGTPSLLNLRQWERVLSAMDRLALCSSSEWTVECNPATVSPDKARLLRSFGVNRISMGVQSLSEQLLERLGRVHSRDMVFRSFDILRQAGFENLNLDLMFAIPGQTMEMWQRTLDEAVALGSEHLSTYEVTYEEDTALYAQLQDGSIAVDEDLACRMYEVFVERVTAAGFQQYEVANFARGTGPTAQTRPRETVVSSAPAWPEPNLPAYACRHNVNYWRGGSFYGLGPSATSCVRGVRTKNWSNTQLYCEQLEKGQRAIESKEALAPLARAGETAAFGLRMVNGWPFDRFRQATGHELREHWRDEMRELVNCGWGRLDPEGFRLTPAGLRFADAAAQLFLR